MSAKSAVTVLVEQPQIVTIPEPRKPYVSPDIHANPFLSFLGPRPLDGWNADVILYKLGRTMGELHLREAGNKPHPAEMTFEYSTAEVRKIVYGLSQTLAEACLQKYGG